MANKILFKSATVSPEVKVNTKNWVQSTNEAGGAAFSFPDKLALAQYAVTGTFNNVFYADAESQLTKIKELAQKVDSVFLAKLAVYSRTSAFMKDTPAFLLAVLHSRRESELLAAVFPKVITSFKMLANFVQIVRSGVTGRKSFGTSTKTLIQKWLESKNAMDIFNGSIGLSGPSVADIIKMVHPKANGADKDAIYAYITEAKNYTTKLDNLPEDVKLFERLKKGEATQIPNIPFRALTNVELNAKQWQSIARNMPWNTLRQNLNMLAKRDVFKTAAFVDEIAAKLADPETVRRTKVFPYQLLAAYLNTEDIPVELRNALQDAAEVSTENVPTFGVRTVVVADVSGSMGSPITGHRVGATTKMRCVDIAGLVSSCVLRQNKNARVMLVDTSLHEANLNPRDSIMTNAQKIAKFGGGGTNLSLPLAQLNREHYNADLVIYVSDNESWAGSRYGTVGEWVTFKKNNPKAKLVNIDIQAYASSQVPDNKDVLNIGGFSDNIWPAIAGFVNGGTNQDFVNAIENSVEL